MSFEIEENAGAIVMRAKMIRFDAVMAPAFRRDALPRVAGAKRVVVDLSSVKTMDSTGLGCLISVLKVLPPGASLALLGVGPEVQTLLKLTRLDRVLRAFDNLEAALAS
jgi:anti-sigma B factor antagonist